MLGADEGLVGHDYEGRLREGNCLLQPDKSAVMLTDLLKDKHSF